MEIKIIKIFRDMWCVDQLLKFNTWFYFTGNDPVSTEFHAVNTVYVVLNFFFCAKPVHLLHFIYPSIYGIIYAIFSVIYQLGGDNPPTYNILNWNKPGTAATCAIILVLVTVPGVHMTFFGLYKLRVFINERCGGKTENVVWVINGLIKI
jgi:hypothetical protein